MTAARNAAVDSVRTVALVGICVVNVPFMALPLPALLQPPAAPLDRAALFAVEALFQGKFFLLFSFVFGWGLQVQLRAATAKGAPAGLWHLRRMLALAAIGCAHAVLVFAGDILVLYALLGLLVWPMRDWAPRRLLRFAAAMAPLAALCLVVIGIAASEPGPLPASSGLGGSFIEATRQRLQDWPLALAFVALFNGPLALAAFAAGMAAAKVDFLAPGAVAFARLRRSTPALLAVAIPLNLAYAFALSGGGWPPGLQLIAFAGLSIGGPALSAAYLVAIVSLAHRIRIPERALAGGRNSLTGYVTDGVIAGLVFGGHGLGLFGTLGHAALLALALGIGVLGLALASAWDRLSPRGPLEALLRRATRGHGG
jgi:uncharacterized protein